MEHFATALGPRSIRVNAIAPGAVQTDMSDFLKTDAGRDPDRPLIGNTPKEKALVTMWERRVELEGFNPTMEAVRNAATDLMGRAIAGAHDYERIPALVERGKQRLKDFYADCNAPLSEVPFVAGYYFSVAGITGVVTVDFATKALRLPIPEDHVALKRWYERVSSNICDHSIDNAGSIISQTRGEYRRLYIFVVAPH